MGSPPAPPRLPGHHESGADPVNAGFRGSRRAPHGEGDGPWTLDPIDGGGVTDEDRRSLGLKTLAEQWAHCAQRNKEQGRVVEPSTDLRQ